ncbi:MAG TPA: GAF domain-containing protein, partial [Candidatus Limnocylindria bacterium]
MSEGLLLEAQRVERTIARIRWGAAALDIVLGPFFPNLWLPGVFLLGLTILIYGVLILRASGRATSIEQHRGIASISFACDLGVLVAAMFLFSSDPAWSTYLIGMVVIITGAFRFGTVGTWSATAALSAAYVAVIAFRQAAFGFASSPERVLFTISVFVLAAVLLDRGLRELRQLRDEREGLIAGLQRRVAEDAALEQVMRIVAGIPSADAIVPAVLRASRDVLRFDRATVFVADEELGQYRPLYRLAADAAAEAVSAPRLKLGEGLLGAAMAGGSTLLVRNLLTDPRFVAVRPNEQPRSVVIVPLRVGGRSVAAFSLSRSTADAFGADDVRLAETVAGLIAQVLENERLFADASQAEALRAADKLKDEFLATISHELRTPITVIAGSLELLAQGRARDSEQLIAQSRRHVERLDRTVQDLLDLAHLQETRVELEREYV